MRTPPPRAVLITTAFTLAAVVAVAAPSTSARADACADVRRVRALAVDEGLDDTSLRTLERRVCPGMLTSIVPITSRPREQPRAAHDVDVCADYSRLAILARADERFAGERLAWIDSGRTAACRGLVAADGETWPNGVRARDASGNWYYPNGLRARASNGTWYYPSGLVARGADGSWQYANGVRAKSADGRWYLPNGERSSPGDLLRRACATASDAPICADDDSHAARDPSRLEAELVLLTFRATRSR